MKYIKSILTTYLILTIISHMAIALMRYNVKTQDILVFLYISCSRQTCCNSLDFPHRRRLYEQFGFYKIPAIEYLVLDTDRDPNAMNFSKLKFRKMQHAYFAIIY
ncbi:MAG: hypothetical protein OMM_08521 [Candidatus Magnetoglobus multicellularis str. Araruama]|uniref:Uncharacterized protein n=1 Tax=Candidatus Magnetoglobus multicellularis str. Araruama TaxID=890399 RepID=A0A1V1P7H3_9BACT|nr:MAG: hypothetical protein OMM_08521 [Candidatus Magnetoglobus multicellularis str. Araruama]